VTPPPPPSTLFPYTTLFRSSPSTVETRARRRPAATGAPPAVRRPFRKKPAVHQERTGFGLPRDFPFGSALHDGGNRVLRGRRIRSEEHTSELQSRENLVCRL